MSEEKKKMYYYYGGKEKKAGEVRKSSEGLVPFRSDFDTLMDRFQREFDDFLAIPPMWKRWMRGRPRSLMMPWVMPSIDLEDRGKEFRITADLPGFSKEDVNIDVGEDLVVIQARKSRSEEEKEKNYVRKERMAQTFYRRIDLPEKVRIDDAQANLKNGILEIVLSKKEPTERKRLTVV